MSKTLLIKKIESQPMTSFDTPFGFQAIFGINSFNLVCGLITAHDLQTLTGVVSLIMQLILFLTKQYYLMKNNIDPDKQETPTATMVDIDAAPFERRCVNCAKPFVPIDPDQIFCESACKDGYMSELKTRSPFPNVARP